MTRPSLLDSPSSYRSLVLRSKNQKNLFLLFPAPSSPPPPLPISLIPILRRHCSYFYGTRTAPRLSVCLSANLHVSSVLVYKLDERARKSHSRPAPSLVRRHSSRKLCTMLLGSPAGGKRKGGVTTTPIPPPPPPPARLHPPQLSNTPPIFPTLTLDIAREGVKSSRRQGKSISWCRSSRF
jgi:hypothetical protein